nr:exocyst complex component EXO70A1-like [Coffea arabica]
MAQQEQDLASVAAARQILKESLEKSWDLDFAIRETGSRLDQSEQRLASLRSAIGNVASKCALYDVRGHVDRALGPAAAVLRIFDVVHELETSLISADPSSDLRSYLINVQRMEEAVKLLRDSCKLVTLWLEDAVQFLQDKGIEGDLYFLKFKKSLMILQQLQEVEENFGLDGGLLMDAFNQLENEFRRLVTDNSFPPPRPDELEVSPIPPPLSFPDSDIEKMQTIMERLTASNRLDRCLSIYIEVRTSIVTTALQALDLSYLELSLSEFDSVQNLEGCIDQWVKHLQFAVKYLFEMEYRLCYEVFQKAGSDVCMECFAKIVLRSGFQNFIKFANSITRSKKEAIKLLKLLDIFAALDELRLNFNRLFSGKSCFDIQTQTRDLIKGVVDGACELFWELSIQVESQRSSNPPSDGSVPRLGLLSGQVQRILEALELNLQTWAKAYEDTNLSHFFRMNNYWYFCKNVEGTKLGDLMGHDWLRAYEDDMEYYAATYVSESWGKLPALISEEDLVLFPGGRAINHNLVQKRIEEFCNAFEDMYKQQSYWVLSDRGLRLRTCQLIMQSVFPSYKSYIQKYMPLIEYEEDTSKYVKYTPAILESMINSLFQPKVGKYGSTKCTHLATRIKNAVTTHLPSTPAAA